jgi:pimeloyl-ACP methyl ester carboxylesterase
VTPPSEPKTEEIGLGAQRLRVSIEGSGPPVLLIMGFAGSLELWEPLRAQLPDRQVVSFDAPGTGGSKASPWPLTIPALARLVDRLCAALGFPTLDVIGYSFGGIIAQQLAARHPKRVRRLVLASTSPGVGSVPGLRAAWQLLTVPPWSYRSAGFLRTASGIFGGSLRHDPASGVRFLPSRVPHWRGWLHQLFAVNTYSSLPILPCIRQEALVLAGDDDPLVPLVNARMIARLLPSARLEIVAGGGHLMLLERAAETGPLIRAFLDAPPGKAATEAAGAGAISRDRR